MYKRHALVRFPAMFLIALIAISSGALTRAASDDQFEMGSRHYAAGRWQLAAAEFSEYLQRFPSDSQGAEASFYLSECHVQLGDHPAAIAELRRFLSRHADHSLAPQVEFRLGECEYLQQHYAEAREPLQHFIARDLPVESRSRKCLALTYLAEIAEHRRDFSTAADYFQQAITICADDSLRPRIRFGLGSAQLALGNLPAAELQWQAVAESAHSLAADARLRLTSLAVKQHQFAAALAHASQIPSERTDLLPHAEYWRGRALAGQKQFADAGQVWQAAADQCPQHPLASRMRLEAARAWKSAGNTSEAETCWQRLISETADQELVADALAELALLQLTGKRLNEALQTCKQLHVRYPTSARLADIEQRLAARLLDQGRYELVHAALARYPNPQISAAEIEYLRAVAEIGLGQQQQAFDRLNAISLGGVSAARAEDILLARVVAAAALGRSAETLRLAETYLDTYAQGRHRAACHSQAIRALIQLGRTDEAQVALSQFVTSQKPQQRQLAELRWLLASAQERASQLEAALATYRELVDQSAEPAVTAHLAIARVLDKLNRTAEAAAELEAAAAANPQYVDRDTVLYQWAWKLIDLGRVADAQHAFQEIYEQYPGSSHWPESVYRLAERAAASGDQAQASRLLDELLASERGEAVQPHAWYLRGQMAAEQKDWPTARQSMQQLLDRFPESALKRQAEFWLAESAYRAGELAESDERFTALAEAIEAADGSQPWMAMVYLRQAQGLARAQRWDESLAITERISVRFPDFSQQFEVDYLCGRALMGLARFEEARAAFERVVDFGNASPETAAMAQWMIGETYLHARRYAEALRAYHRVELRHSVPRWQAAAALQIGTCHEARGELPEALAAYSRAAQQYGQSSFASEGQRRLEQLSQVKAVGLPAAAP